MNRLLLVSLLLLLPSVAFSGDNTPEGNPSPALKKIAAALEPVMKDLKPKGEMFYSNEGKSLTLRHLPQKFRIHGVSMTGEVSAEAHDEVGPSYKGFVLKIHLQPKGEVNQLVTPQTLRRPYWTTDLNVIPLPGTELQAYVGLSYGGRTDPKLLKELRARLAALKE